MENNEIIVITPFYNPGNFLDLCVNSIMTQKYDNFKVVFIDDASTDNSWDKLPHNDERAICIRNEENLTALENIHNATMKYAKKDSICVLIDGDDWLPNKKVFSKINNVYKESDCWLTYGQSQWTDNRRGFATLYPKEEFENLRNHIYRVSHIRTYKAGLYHSIKNQDPDFLSMKDKSGNFYKMTYDVAMFIPMMEMAGYEKVKFIDEILYIYNRDNPISDDKKNQKLQWEIHAEIIKKQPFKKIDKI